MKSLRFLTLTIFFSNDEINFNFTWLLDIKRKKDEYKMEVVQNSELNLLIFIFDGYYYFNCKLEEYLIQYLQRDMTSTKIKTFIRLNINFICQKQTLIELFL